jgi:hypothetical protein
MLVSVSKGEVIRKFPTTTLSMNRHISDTGQDMKRHAKKEVPYYIFDEHNEAFYYWHKARYEGLIEEPLDLFHLDAHSDMSGPRLFRKSLYYPIGGKDRYLEYYDDFAKTELDINNFIVPAILNRIVKNVYFIYPPWRKLTPSRRTLNICSAFGEGKILKYNITREEGAAPGILYRAMPDLKHFSYHAMDIERIPMKRKVILDIDLDYFACRDSTPNLIGYELEITREEFINKKVNLGNKTLIFSVLETSFKEKEGRYYAEIGHRKVKELSYMPSLDEIGSEIEKVASVLARKKTIPVIITMCRSCESGYCPKDYYKLIEHQLAQRLFAL